MPERLLLQVREISKAFGEKIIFDEASVSIVEKQKIGVIGRNGAGKSTFFKMLMGDEEIDTGEVMFMPQLKLGYIPQVDPFTPDETVIDFLVRYTNREDWECGKVAGQFGIKNEKLAGKIGDLSGGYQMRVKLAATLLFDPNLLLLDEPTNYLDLSTLILLEKFLQNFRGAFMVITHDREFLKKTCTSTLDVDNGQLFMHLEGLEEYLEFKEEQKALAESVNTNIERKQKQLQEFVSRFGAKASMAKSAKSKEKQIVRLDAKKITINKAFSSVRMLIPEVEDKQGIGFTAKNLSIGYANKVVVGDINIEVDRGKKVVILGDNGQGKSTLLKTIAGELDKIGGSVGFKEGLKVSYYAQHVNLALLPDETIESYIRRTASKGVKDDEIFRMLGNFLFKKADYAKQIGFLSGGEKARLCMAGMFLTKSDVYLLDEPTNHLDFETVEAMGAALGRFNGTVFVVSHNRTFVSLIANEILEVKDGRVKRVLGSYENYVWLLEQESENIQSPVQNTIEDPYSKPNTKELSKEEKRKQFELRKDLQKIERKIKNLQTLVEQGVEVDKNQAIINDQEVLWLEVKEQIG